MSLSIVAQFVVVLAAIWMGARYSGVGFGLWGAVGLLVLVAAFGVEPTSPPVDVMLIILAVIMATPCLTRAKGAVARHFLRLIKREMLAIVRWRPGWGWSEPVQLSFSRGPAMNRSSIVVFAAALAVASPALGQKPIVYPRRCMEGRCYTIK
jgi:hypothetical protein